MDNEDIKHESYGMLQISRVNCGAGNPLFGSSIKHSNMIELSIHEGYLNRHLNRDWFHAGKRIITIAMSYNQFADAMTNLNCGDGVPTTITYKDGKYVEKCPFISKNEQHHEELRQAFEELQKKVTELSKQTDELLGKKTLNKADKESISKGIEYIRREMSSNLPFIQEQFEKQMDKTVTEAKSEIEGFMTTTILNAGIEALNNDIKLISDNV